MDTASLVKSIREKLGLTQAGLAQQMGVDQGTVSNWETGKSAPRGPAKVLLDQMGGRSPSVGAQQ